MVVKFPQNERVLRRMGLAEHTERVRLDQEIRQIDNELSALKERKRRLLLLYRREIDREIGLERLLN